MQYDGWGNLIRRRRCGLSEPHYTQDAENRLIAAEGTGTQGRFRARYHYDALSRRIRRPLQLLKNNANHLKNNCY